MGFHRFLHPVLRDLFHRQPEAENLPAAVFQALEKGELGFDELQQITGAAPQDLMSTLTVLQIRKMIDPLPGKKYRLRS